jgi:hypothetical protein
MSETSYFILFQLLSYLLHYTTYKRLFNFRMINEYNIDHAIKETQEIYVVYTLKTQSCHVNKKQKISKQEVTTTLQI